MGFFRNAEMRRTMLLFLLITAAAVAAAAIWDIRFGVWGSTGPFCVFSVS